MLSALDQTIRQILLHEGRLDPREVDISFEIPRREWSAGISRPTLNCYLFDIRENLDLRQQGWQVEQQGERKVRRQAPLRFDLTYLITAWTRVVEDEHRLLWHTLQTLARFPTLPEQHFQGALQAHEQPIYASTARPDGVLKSPSEFWAALENVLKPSLSLVLSLALDRDVLASGPLVLSTQIGFQQIGQGDGEREQLAYAPAAAAES